MPGFVIGGLGGAGTGEGIPSRTEYYYTYTWEIFELFATAFIRHPLICLKDMTLPAITITKEMAQGSSLEYKYAKSVNWEDVRITWYDTVGLLDQMVEWRGRVWDEVCGIRDATSYKFNSQLSTFLPTWEMENNWKLFNSWPSVIRYGDVTYANSDVKLVEVVVTYDWAIETPASQQ